MVAAVAITLRQRKDAKSQNASAQAHVKSSDRLTMVAVAADMSAHQTNPPVPVVAEVVPVAPPTVVAGSQEKK